MISSSGHVLLTNSIHVQDACLLSGYKEALLYKRIPIQQMFIE